MKKTLNILGLALAAALAAAPASAKIFFFQGDLTDGSTVGGSLEIDPVTGEVLNVDVSSGAPSSSNFINLLAVLPNTGATQTVLFVRNAANTFDLNFTIDAPTLVGFDGGVIAGATLYNLIENRTDALLVGPAALTALTAVPEPATWALTILGFGAAGASLRQRRAIAAA